MGGPVTCICRSCRHGRFHLNVSARIYKRRLRFFFCLLTLFSINYPQLEMPVIEIVSMSVDCGNEYHDVKYNDCYIGDWSRPILAKQIKLSKSLRTMSGYGWENIDNNSNNTAAKSYVVNSK